MELDPRSPNSTFVGKSNVGLCVVVVDDVTMEISSQVSIRIIVVSSRKLKCVGFPREIHFFGFIYRNCSAR